MSMECLDDPTKKNTKNDRHIEIRTEFVLPKEDNRLSYIFCPPTTIVSVGGSTLKFWNTETGECERKVKSVAFGPDTFFAAELMDQWDDSHFFIFVVEVDHSYSNPRRLLFLNVHRPTTPLFEFKADRSVMGKKISGFARISEDSFVVICSVNVDSQNPEDDPEPMFVHVFSFSDQTFTQTKKIELDFLSIGYDFLHSHGRPYPSRLFENSFYFEAIPKVEVASTLFTLGPSLHHHESDLVLFDVEKESILARVENRETVYGFETIVHRNIEVLVVGGDSSQVFFHRITENHTVLYSSFLIIDTKDWINSFLVLQSKYLFVGEIRGYLQLFELDMDKITNLKTCKNSEEEDNKPFKALEYVGRDRMGEISHEGCRFIRTASVHKIRFLGRGDEGDVKISLVLGLSIHLMNVKGLKMPLKQDVGFLDVQERVTFLRNDVDQYFFGEERNHFVCVSMMTCKMERIHKFLLYNS